MIENNTFRNNSAQLGGALYIINSQGFHIASNEITHSSAIGNGGGLYLTGSALEGDFIGNNFSNCNSSDGMGGAIYLDLMSMLE